MASSIPSLNSALNIRLNSAPKVSDPVLYEALLNIHTAIEIIINSPLQQSATGPAAVVGNATLVAGAVTVNTTAAKSSSVIILTKKINGGTAGTIITYTITNGVSFTISSNNALDTSTFSWLIVGTY